MFAEAVGICILVTFGLGVVCMAISTGGAGPWQVSAVWGFGLAIAIYTTGSISGGHLNPAVSLSMALLRPKSFPLMHLPLYWIAQFLGAIAGAVINLIIFHNMMLAKEKNGGYSRGDQASVFTASGWVGVFPAASMVYGS